MKEYITLGEVCEKGSSTLMQKDLSLGKGPYKIYGASGLLGTVDFYKQEKEYIGIVKDGAGVGRAMLLPEKSSCIGTMQYIIPRENINVRFLFYAIESMNLAKYNTGATIPHIYFKDYKKEVLPLVDIQEQQEIAHQLDKIRSLISYRQSQLKHFDELVKSQFIEMFGDPIINEKGWAICKLSDVAELKIGPFGSLLHKEDYVVGGHCLINPSHIVDGKIVPDSALSLTQEKYVELSSYHLYQGDIVLGRRGEMGRCAVVLEDGLFCGTGCMIVRPNGKILPYFLRSVLSSPSMKMLIEERAVGVTMANLNVPIVSNLPIPMYPMEKQKDYIKLLQQTDKSKVLMEQARKLVQILIKLILNIGTIEKS
ncbi:MAG: restriction endonuclease subunit S, partial [Firmicutes bacterium]|nr:restriction endonuclease subunit S [Bacillota bacterium]